MKYICRIFLFIAALAPASGEHDHVALLKCDQKNFNFEILTLGKGNEKIITKNIMEIQNTYLFNEFTAKVPSRHIICLVMISYDERKNIQRQITWINPKKSIELQLSNLGVNEKLIRKLLGEFQMSHKLP